MWMSQSIRRAGRHTTWWLLLLVIVLTGGAGEAHAVNLYMNIQDDFVDITVVGDIVGQTTRRQIAMAFTTGDNAGGYTLSTISMYVSYRNKTPGSDPPIPDAMPRVSIYTDSSGSPGTSLYVLTTPTIPYDTAYDDYGGYGPYGFTAPTSAALNANTTYFVVFEDTGTDGYWKLALQHLTSTLETVASGWSAGTRFLRKDGTGAWGNGVLLRKVYMEIDGTIDAEVDTTAPMLDMATVDGRSLVLTYNEDLDEGSEPATTAYSVSVNSGSGVAPSSVDVTGKKVTLTLGTAVTAGQTVTVTYTVPSSNPVQDTSENDAAALANQSVTNNTNAHPVFTNATETRSIDETVAAATVQTAADIGAAITASDAENDTLTYTLEGTDAGKFTIGSTSGQLQTKVGESYDYEANTSYSVTIKADDSNGGTDTVAVTINVTNNTTEIPLTPTAPTVTATSGSTTSLDVRWTAPTNTGRPTITGYDLQYRKGDSGSWTNGPQNVAGTSSTITGLDANSAYQVQVLATNADGDSGWSSPGSGRTANNAPQFSSSSITRTLAETVGDATVQTAANIGAAVEATDDDGDTLEYTLEGADAGKFTIVSSSGQLRTKVGEAYDREAKASYTVTVKASDGTANDTISVTINITNATEKPLTPVAPTVTTTSGSTTSVDVTWTAPSNTGRPTISSYDLQYRKGTSGSWTDGPQNQTGTSATISGLDGNSEYQVQMRATNADGDSDWSSPGEGSTANNAPSFSNSSTSRTLAETIADATVQTAANIGAAVTATDPDNDTLTYSLEGSDAGKFTIGSSSGQIQTKVGEAYDYEASTSYSVTVKASDTGGGSAVITVTINITNNTTENPLAPAAPTVVATTGVTMSLDVTWTAPSNTGRPTITGYDLQYRKGTSGNWSNGPQNVTGTSATISGLDGNSEYQVQVRATNADGDSDWSSPGSGETANTPPEFSDDSTVRSFEETVGDTTVQAPADIGAVITATDPDNDTLEYTLEGTDADKFTIEPSTGQIQTKVGESYNYEATTRYEVTVKADDSKGSTDTIAVTVNVINVPEFVSANVPTTGAFLEIEFDSQLSSVLSPISALTVTADGETAEFHGSTPISVQGGTNVRLRMKNPIREGQTVTVSYTDPTSGNDPNAIQGGSGIDAPSFTEPVTNDSTEQPGVPSPVTELTVTIDANNRFDLSWVAPVDNGGRIIEGYWIEWSADWDLIDASAAWQDVNPNTGSQQTRHIHTPLPGQTRSYRVSAINSVGTGAESNVITETSRTGDGTPSAPRRLEASAAHRQIDLSWEPPGYEGEVGVEVTGYKIERSADGVTDWTDLVADTGTTATTYADTNLDFGTQWHYRVSAINSVGAGQTATVDATTLNRNTPTEPLNLRTILSPTQVLLKWDPPADDGGAVIRGYEYRLIYESGPGGWVLALLVHDRSIYEHLIFGLEREQTYTIEFRAYNVNGQGRVREETVTLPLVASTPSGPDDTETVQNIPPVVAIPLVDQSAMIDVPFSYVMDEGTFTDADGDPLTYSASLSDGTALPTWLTFAPDTGTFSGTPGPSDTGQMLVRVTASDGLATVSDEFALTVVIVDESVLSAWLSRFGRTVGSHVTDAIGQRVRGSRRSHVTLAGHQLTLGETDTREPPNNINREPELTGDMQLEDFRAAVDRQGPNAGIDRSLWAEEESEGQEEGQAQTLDDLRELIAGSAFQLALNPDDAGASPRLTAWGRVAGTQFDGHEGDIALDGDVLTATLGVDRAHGPWLAGVALSHSQGDGGYSMEDTELQGDLENDLTSIHPYLRYAVNDGLDVWGVLGYGRGELSIKHETGDTLRTDTKLRMAAFGARGTLLAAPEPEDLELTTQTELMFTQMRSDKIPELPSTNAYAHQLRVTLEGSRAFTWETGQQLTPSLELGIRNDWGSAETGFGLEVGGRMRYADPASRLTLEGTLRGLLAHEADHYREWGASGTLRLEPGVSGRGLSLALVSNWGNTASGVEGMWSRQTLSGFVPQDQDPAQDGSLEVQLGYGFWMPAMEGRVTPFTQVTVSNTGESRSRTGLEFYRRNTWAGPIRAEFAGERIESDDGQPEHRIGLQVHLQLGRSNSPLLVERGNQRTKSR